ncbi:hypothetical protein [Methylobacterium persicinum]|uniref:Uncharacterized protein n=1 Tax=Methylobacterium persicinum TaxID=374426 RepID=A0ABU0HFA5_9HYPH|nr:hypothetical protein [Methylobacterium persicinum]MDQ0441005.1 hypothetical protein [Methylobacterium persicinum]GJE40012.1 hypothetical protein KHHGKMAE_4102 [Methylobacterium persicinum]
MNSLTVPTPMKQRGDGNGPTSLRRSSGVQTPDPGGGEAILDLALCLILAVAVTGLLVLAL